VGVAHHIVLQYGPVLRPNCLDLLSFEEVVTSNEACEDLFTLIREIEEQRVQLGHLFVFFAMRSQD